MRAQFHTKLKRHIRITIQIFIGVFSVLLAPSPLLSQETDTPLPTILTINHSWDGAQLPESEHAKLTLSWLATGDLQINIDSPFANEPPPNCDTQSCWELWEYEVVELFLVGAGDPAPYTEIEISPWGNYLVLQLFGSRNLIERELPLNIISVNREDVRWTAEAVLSKDLIPQGNLNVNVYRVHGAEPDRSYHVVTPLGGSKPDFHRIEEFELVVIQP